MSDADQLIARQHANPHAYLGAHPENGSVVVRTFRPAASKVEVVAPDGTHSVARAGPPRRRLRGPPEGRRAAARLPARGRLRRVRARSRSTTRTASCRRSASSTCTCSARAATRSCGSASARTCARSTASSARRSRSGRRAPARSPSSATSTSGTAASTRCARSARPASGSCSCPASGAGAHYKYEILAPDGEIRLKADPVAFETEVPPKTASVVHEPKHEWADEEWLAERRKSSALEGPMSIYEVHLGSWRLNPLEGNRSLTYLELADELSAYAQGHGLHPHRAAAGDGAPVHRLVGLPGDGLLRADAALRLARRLPRVRRPPAPERARRDPRLGPGALPARRLRARPLRRHRALRARRPAPRRAPRLGHAGLQLRPPRGPQLPRLQRPVLAATSTTPTASASTPSPRCSTSTTRARRASGCRTSTAATRTSTPSSS